MKLEDQVCSLELAKKLKELGIKQNSLFYWCNVKNWEYKSVLRYCPENIDRELALSGFAISAFTVAELGEMLPQNHADWMIGYSKENGNQWHLWLHSSCAYLEDKTIAIKDVNESNARAKMLIHLIEQGLMVKKKK